MLHQQIWEYKVEEELYMEARQQNMLNATGLMIAAHKFTSGTLVGLRCNSTPSAHGHKVCCGI